MADGGAGLRLFAAIEVPQAQIDSIALALEPLKGLVPGARWTGVDKWHVTLKFFGEVQESALDSIQKAVESAAAGGGPVETNLEALGAFPSLKRARVLWVGLADREGLLSRAAGRIAQGAGMPDEGPFTPHLTLARLKIPGPALELGKALTPPPWDRAAFTVDRIKLIHSTLGSKGSSYKVLNEFLLVGG